MGVLFTMDVYFRSKTQHNTVKYNQQLSKHTCASIFRHLSHETTLLSAYQEKIPARNAIYAHAQDFAASEELLLAILKAFFPQPLNKQQTVGFHVF
jgi:hypothetical protein